MSIRFDTTSKKVLKPVFNAREKTAGIVLAVSVVGGFMLNLLQPSLFQGIV